MIFMCTRRIWYLSESHLLQDLWWQSCMSACLLSCPQPIKGGMILVTMEQYTLLRPTKELYACLTVSYMQPFRLWKCFGVWVSAPPTYYLTLSINTKWGSFAHTDMCASQAFINALLKQWDMYTRLAPSQCYDQSPQLSSFIIVLQLIALASAPVHSQFIGSVSNVEKMGVAWHVRLSLS